MSLGAVNAFSDRIVRATRALFKPDAKIVTLGSRDLYLKSNYQDFGRYAEADLAIAGDGEASLPALTEQIKRLVDAGRKSAFEARGKTRSNPMRSLPGQVNRRVVSRGQNWVGASSRKPSGKACSLPSWTM